MRSHWWHRVAGCGAKHYERSGVVHRNAFRFWMLQQRERQQCVRGDTKLRKRESGSGRHAELCLERLV
jgi:hypothetical protein